MNKRISSTMILLVSFLLCVTHYHVSAFDSPDGAILNHGVPMSPRDHYERTVALATYGASALCTEELSEWLAVTVDKEIMFSHAKERLSWGSWTLVSLKRIFTLFNDGDEEARKSKVIMDYEVQLMFDNMWLAYHMLQGTCSSNAVRLLDSATTYTLNTTSRDVRSLDKKERTLITSFSRNVRRNGASPTLSEYEQIIWRYEIFTHGGLRGIYSIVQAEIATNIESMLGLRTESALGKASPDL